MLGRGKKGENNKMNICEKPRDEFGRRYDGKDEEKLDTKMKLAQKRELGHGIIGR